VGEFRQSAPWGGSRSDEMRTPDEVAAMLRLKRLGWGVRRIAREFGCSHMTVRRYLAAGGWNGYRRRRRSKQLDGLESWISERFHRHAGNADVVRQELAAEHGVQVSLRTVERAVKELRRELRAQAVATTRFETAPGEQMQIDFGERRVAIAGERVRTYFFVATLGYSVECTFVPSGASARSAGSRAWRAPLLPSVASPRRCSWTTLGRW
jgi:transposase